MSEIYHRYQHGEKIPSKELNNNDGLRLYGEIIHFEWRNDKATQEPDMDGEVWFKKVHPIQPRNLRPTEIQESQERCKTFEKCKEWQIPLVSKRVKTHK